MSHGAAGAGQGAIKGAATGATIGSAFGPLGAAVGGGIGLLLGGIGGGVAGSAEHDEQMRQEALARKLEEEERQRNRFKTMGMPPMSAPEGAGVPAQLEVSQTPQMQLTSAIGRPEEAFKAYLRSRYKQQGGA